MGIFTVLLSVCIGAITTMTTTLGKSQGIADSTTEVRRAFDRMDRQMRYADAVNLPVPVGTSYYVEFRTSADGDNDGMPTCTQWRLDAATDELQVRTWETSGTGTSGLAPWETVARHIVNDPAAADQRPFTFAAAGRTFPAIGPVPAEPPMLATKTTRQRLRVFLRSTSDTRDAGTGESFVDFAARNSSAASETNADQDNDGVPNVSVCTQAGRP